MTALTSSQKRPSNIEAVREKLLFLGYRMFLARAVNWLRREIISFYVLGMLGKLF
jgi:hypothetical protein